MLDVQALARPRRDGFAAAPPRAVLTPLAWLLGFVLPACGVAGAQGVPASLPDFTRLVRPASPNTALAAPPGFVPKPDIVTPSYPVPAERLFAAVEQVAARQPATFVLARDAAGLRESWVARSLVLNFPDIIWAEARPAGSAASQLVLYSRSLYGYGDFGVNRRRVAAWVAAVGAALWASGQR
jgi:uncharacterized protein (DUF1499 family)